MAALRLAMPATNGLPGLRRAPAMGEVKASDASDASDEISLALWVAVAAGAGRGAAPAPPLARPTGRGGGTGPARVHA